MFPTSEDVKRLLPRKKHPFCDAEIQAVITTYNDGLSVDRIVAACNTHIAFTAKRSIGEVRNFYRTLIEAGLLAKRQDQIRFINARESMRQMRKAIREERNNNKKMRPVDEPVNEQEDFPKFHNTTAKIPVKLTPGMTQEEAIAEFIRLNGVTKESPEDIAIRELRRDGYMVRKTGEDFICTHANQTRIYSLQEIINAA